MDATTTMPRRLVLLVIAVGVLVIVAGALGFRPFGSGDSAICLGTRHPAPAADARIAACTRQIERDGSEDEARAVHVLARGQAYADLGQRDTAAADYDAAIAADPNLAAAYIARGLARADRGQQEAAVADFEQAIRLRP